LPGNRAVAFAGGERDAHSRIRLADGRGESPATLAASRCAIVAGRHVGCAPGRRPRRIETLMRERERIEAQIARGPCRFTTDSLWKIQDLKNREDPSPPNAMRPDRSIV